MKLKLLADYHLGAPLPEWGPRDQERGSQIFEALEASVESALEGEADALLVGGDLFDRPDPEEGVAQQALHLLASAAESIPVVVVPGTYDNLTHAESIWRRNLPDNLVLMDSPKITSVQVTTPAGPLWVYGAAWRPGRNPENVWEALRRTEDDGVHVGLVHANWAGAGEQTSPGWTIREKDLQDCDLDLVLLGGPHNFRQSRVGSCVVVSPGTPVGLGYGEWGDRYDVSAVVGPDGAKIRKELRRVDPVMDASLDIEPGWTPEQIIQAVKSTVPEGALARVTLTGRLRAPVDVERLSPMLPNDRLIELADGCELEFPQYSEGTRITVERMFDEAMEAKWRQAKGEEKREIMQAYKQGVLALSQKGASHAH